MKFSESTYSTVLYIRDSNFLGSFSLAYVLKMMRLSWFILWLIKIEKKSLIIHLKLKSYNSQLWVAAQATDTVLHSVLNTRNFSMFGRWTSFSCVCFHISVVDLFPQAMREFTNSLLFYVHSPETIKSTLKKDAINCHFKLCGMFSQWCLYFLKIYIFLIFQL